MDEFMNTLDPEKFRKTNGLWNSLMLNDPWSVGYVSTLIELKTFQNKEEWEEFYYEMGDYRNKQFQDLSASTVAILEDEQLIRTNRKNVDTLAGDLKAINTQNGRTKSQLAKKGKILFENIKTSAPDISLDDCIECVRYRVICETWNGIIIREKNTIRVLKTIFTDLTFEKQAGDFDHRYAVDYEIKKGTELICGIQIKPKSYTFDTPYLNKARSANHKKNAEYSEKFGKPVFDVISKGNGEIQNPDVIQQIKALIK